MTNSTCRARWLASSEVISQVLFTSEQPKKNKTTFVGILSQIKSLFGPLDIQHAWYILKKLSTSVSVKVVDIYLIASRFVKYPPLFTSTSVNNIIAKYWNKGRYAILISSHNLIKIWYRVCLQNYWLKKCSWQHRMSDFLTMCCFFLLF